MKKISVIIPVYNTEKYLPRAINSIMESSIINSIEIIVVDDASSGNCKEIVEQYSTVRYIKHETNQGLFQARYTGIIHASGEFIVHLDPDDWVVNDIYKKAYETALLNSSDVVLFNVVQCDESGKEWFENYNMLPEFQNKSGKDILEQIYFFGSRHWIWHVCWNKLIKKEVAQDLIGNIQNYKHLLMYEDLLWSTLLFVNVKDRNSISSLKIIGLKYFRHKESITHVKDSKVFIKKIEDTLFVLDTIENLFIRVKLKEEYSMFLLETKYYIFSLYFQKNLKNFKSIYPQFKSIYTFLTTYDKQSMENLLLEKSADEIIQKLLKIGLKKVTIFGLGDFSRVLLCKLRHFNIDITSFTVSNPTNGYFESLPIYTIEEALDKGNTNFVIASLGSFYLIKESILNANKESKCLNIIGKFD
ncbi:glycosyltransferase family 2 protein [Aliarcobacter cryaerophilus]|uniref:Glycosyltransferase 2-like domain-containing protein n=1 Tax=Aliarcobacter cryaerophilus TaxID=28198 RepID=A0A2S9SNM2_9BACT|nr:glycosyltransferase family 2 protein [Aliarcobacter cryaerophilus]PRM88166.1 hypothetical protein CJ669_05285 [Aliarcobacter cryaerophilus]